MRRIISIILVLIIMFSLSTYCVEEDLSLNIPNLSAAGIKINDMGVSDINAPATRASLAYLVSKMISDVKYEPVNTKFYDVDKSNPLSGYINNIVQAGFMNGIDEFLFNPTSTITKEMLCKVLVLLSDYGEFAELLGGYPTGYTDASKHLGIYDCIYTSSDNSISYQNLLKTFEAYLINVYDELSFGISGTSVKMEKTGRKKRILTDKLLINVYEGIITDVNTSNFSVEFEVTGNAMDTNNIMLIPGTKKLMKASLDIDVYKYSNIPLTIWVNNDGKIVFALPQKDINVLLTTVESVNLDFNPDNSYGSDFIKKLSFYDDKKVHSTSSDFKVKYNCEETKSPVSLVDKFVKAVFRGNEVIYIETWELQEGGIITEVYDTEFLYTKNDSNKVFGKLDTYDEMLVYINSEGVTIGRLKKNTYFDYYINENKNFLVIVASEKKITGELETVSEDEICIDGILYSKKSDIYVCENKNFPFEKNGKIYNLLNKKVDAYFDASGICRYVSISSESSSELSFIGALMGSQTDTFGEEIKLKLLVLEPDIQKNVYILSQKAKFNCTESKREILNTVSTQNSIYLFEFKLNEKGEISEINNYTPYYGISNNGHITGIKSFTTDTAHVMDSGKRIYINDSPIIVIMEKDGSLDAEYISWSKLSGKSADNFNIKMIGNGMNTKMRMMVVYGDFTTLRSDMTYGIVNDLKTVLSDNGEPSKMLSVFGMSEKTYKISSDKALPEKMTMLYYAETPFAEDEIYIENTFSVQEFKENYETMGWKKATVYKADKYRVYFREGGAEFFHPSKCSTIKITADGKVEKISKENMNDGETIYYILNSNAYGIFAAVVIE